MSKPVLQGWHGDPAGRHEYRWFSQGRPTDLVKDGRTTSRDSISDADPAVYQSMQLAQEPDVGPLLHSDPPPPKLELINVTWGGSMGYAGVVNTADPSAAVGWKTGPGVLQRILISLPVFAYLFLIPLVLLYGLPVIVLLAPALLSILVAVVGRLLRRRKSRQFRRPATGARMP